jgi:hypothetical protein
MSSEPDVGCRHLLICRTIWYDPGNPDEGYSLGRLVVNVRPHDGAEGPFVVPRLFAFTQLFGTVGDYDARVRLVRVELNEDGDEVFGEPTEWGPWSCPITGLDLVESHGFVLVDVPFGEPAVYEFQLWLDGFDEPSGQERVEVRAEVREE